MKTLHAFLAFLLLSSQAASGAVLVGSTDDSLLTLDPASGAATPRCAAGAPGAIAEIEAAPDGTLFATTADGSSLLFVLDPDDCGATVVGEHSPAGSIDGLEFVGATLYGAFSEEHGESGPGDHPSVFVLVHVDHGGITALAELPFHPVRGLAWNEATGLLYGIGPAIGARERDEAGAGDVLFRIDPETFATAAVGATGYAYGSLEFGPDGVLYAGEAEGDHEGGGAALHVIDPATGAATPIGPTGASSITGLAFVPEGPSPLAVPALSATAALALSAALAFAAVARMRGRRAGSGSLSHVFRSKEEEE
jgi:hypothetical protein